MHLIPELPGVLLPLHVGARLELHGTARHRRSQVLKVVGLVPEWSQHDMIPSTLLREDSRALIHPYAVSGVSWVLLCWFYSLAERRGHFHMHILHPSR